MEAMKENYSQPILIKQASLRDVTATGSHSNHNNNWDKSNHKVDFKQIFSFIKNIIGNYRNRN